MTVICSYINLHLLIVIKLYHTLSVNGFCLPSSLLVLRVFMNLSLYIFLAQVVLIFYVLSHLPLSVLVPKTSMTSRAPHAMRSSTMEIGFSSDETSTMCDFLTIESASIMNLLRKFLPFQVCG